MNLENNILWNKNYIKKMKFSYNKSYLKKDNLKKLNTNAETSICGWWSWISGGGNVR